MVQNTTTANRKNNSRRPSRLPSLSTTPKYGQALRGPDHGAGILPLQRFLCQKQGMAARTACPDKHTAASRCCLPLQPDGTHDRRFYGNVAPRRWLGTGKQCNNPGFKDSPKQAYNALIYDPQLGLRVWSVLVHHPRVPFGFQLIPPSSARNALNPAAKAVCEKLSTYFHSKIIETWQWASLPQATRQRVLHALTQAMCEGAVALRCPGSTDPHLQ